MMTKGLFKRQVTKGQRFAYERTGNWFYWNPQHETSPTSNQVPQGFSFDTIGQSEHLGSAISVLNTWPEQVHNKSLFEYLHNPNQSEFATLILQNYQCACAIVFYDQNGANIIGSGGRLDDGKVVTARHVVSEHQTAILYARFFSYQVQTNGPRFIIFEDYVDIPILAVNASPMGYDFVLLDVPVIQDAYLNNKYYKGIPRYTNQGQSQLPDGKYIMFHFADGIPQVSIGEVAQYSPRAGALQNIIGLEAGPGASGAMLLWSNINKSLSVAGISVYRQFNNDNVERLCISFADIRIPPLQNNKAAPYQDPNFSIFRPLTPRNEDGYEFYRWYSGFYQKYGKSRPDHPEHPLYAVQEGHSNHHVVQCIDLYWLYAYFYEYQDNTHGRTLELCCPPAVVEIVKQEHLKHVKKKTIALQQEIAEDVDLHYKTDQPDKAKQQLWEKKYPDLEKELRTTFLDNLRAAVKKRYEPIQKLIDQLCWPFKAGRAEFIWGIWNLFKGPTSRNDDPKYRTFDRCESTKPKSFNPSLWQLLTDKKDGLDAQIKALKYCTNLQDDHKLQIAEQGVGISLSRISQFWRKKYPMPQHVKAHEYEPDDWEITGQQDGTDSYSIKLK